MCVIRRRFSLFRLLLRRKIDRLFGDIHMIIALLEGDPALKILMTSQTTKVRAEGAILQTPFRAAQRPSATGLAVEIHLTAIDVRVFQVADIVVLKGHAAVKFIVTGIEILHQQLGIVQRLEA